MKRVGVWNGSHLLDCVIDRDSYSKETITLSARMLPPKGGAPINIEISGSRTNLSDLLDQLTRKVRDGLKISTKEVSWVPEEDRQHTFGKHNGLFDGECSKRHRRHARPVGRWDAKRRKLLNCGFEFTARRVWHSFRTGFQSFRRV